MYNIRSLHERNPLRAAGGNKYGEATLEKLARSLILFFFSFGASRYHSPRRRRRFRFPSRARRNRVNNQPPLRSILRWLRVLR